MAPICHKNFNFLVRSRQLRNNRSNFIEYLVPALQLTALFCVLHSFISNEGEFRPTVSKILNSNHVVRTVYDFMFYSMMRGLNLVSLGVGKVHGGYDLLVRNNLVVFTTIPELMPIRPSHTAQKFSSHAKIYFAERRGKTLRPLPLHNIFRVCPRLPN